MVPDVAVYVTYAPICSVLSVRTNSTRRPRRHTMEEPKVPKFDYQLDESDPDIAVLRRQDGAFVAAFSDRGAIREDVVEAAKEDYRALLEERTLP